MNRRTRVPAVSWLVLVHVWSLSAAGGEDWSGVAVPGPRRARPNGGTPLVSPTRAGHGTVVLSRLPRFGERLGNRAADGEAKISAGFGPGEGVITFLHGCLAQSS
jgi:hypothetical protein